MAGTKLILAAVGFLYFLSVHQTDAEMEIPMKQLLKSWEKEKISDSSLQHNIMLLLGSYSREQDLQILETVYQLISGKDDEQMRCFLNVLKVVVQCPWPIEGIYGDLRRSFRSGDVQYSCNHILNRETILSNFASWDLSSKAIYDMREAYDQNPDVIIKFDQCFSGAPREYQEPTVKMMNRMEKLYSSHSVAVFTIFCQVISQSHSVNEFQQNLLKYFTDRIFEKWLQGGTLISYDAIHYSNPNDGDSDRTRDQSIRTVVVHHRRPKTHYVTVDEDEDDDDDDDAYEETYRDDHHVHKTGGSRGKGLDIDKIKNLDPKNMNAENLKKIFPDVPKEMIDQFINAAKGDPTRLYDLMRQSGVAGGTQNPAGAVKDAAGAAGKAAGAAGNAAGKAAGVAGNAAGAAENAAGKAAGAAGNAAGTAAGAAGQAGKAAQDAGNAAGKVAGGAGKR